MTTTVQRLVNFRELGSRLVSAVAGTNSGSPRHQKSGLVLILDLHGVLVERISNKDKNRLDEARKHRPCWKSQKKHKVWLRPHLETFLKLANSRHDLAVWSSAMPRTIEKLLDDITTEFSLEPSLENMLLFKRNRDQCKKDRQATSHYATTKPLRELWDDTRYKGRCTPQNTLLLDDSESKFRHTLRSGILVPEYSVDALKEQYNDDDTLLWVLLYVEYLLTEAQRERTPAGSWDISAVRTRCMKLEDFINAGKLSARIHASQTEEQQSQPLVFEFLGDLRGTGQDHDRIIPSELHVGSPSNRENPVSTRTANEREPQPADTKVLSRNISEAAVVQDTSKASTKPNG